MRDADQQDIRVAVDPVVFTLKDNQLHVLLVTRKYPPYQGKLAFPGGYVRTEESIDQAAARELGEETGVKHVFLRQVRSYGAVDRDPRHRVVAIAYLALIDHARYQTEASTDAQSVHWVPVADVGALAFDHNAILADVLAALRYEIQTTTIANQILPPEFSLTELQSLYEAVLDRSLDKRNFRKRLGELNILVDTGKQRREGAHRPAALYRFRDANVRPIKDAVRVFV